MSASYGGSRLAFDSSQVKSRELELHAAQEKSDVPPLLAQMQEHRAEAMNAARVSEVEKTLDAGLSAALDSFRQATQGQKDIFGTIYGVFDKFPEGRSVTKDKFEEVFGAKSAELLDTLGVQSIDVTNNGNGQHYTVGFAQKETRAVKSSEITHEQSVEFDVTKDADNIKLDHIKGLKVRKLGGHFDATVDRLDIKRDNEGNTILTGKGHWGFIRGTKIITITPDGSIRGDK